MKLLNIILAGSIAVMTGCATVTGDSMQTLALTTSDASGAPVEQAECDLRNEKGVWQATSPSMVSVHKAAGDLDVVCKKEGHADGNLRAVSRAGAGMYGNILIGGGVGAIIDHSKGTAYNYPNNLPVVMGQMVIVDRKDKE